MADKVNIPEDALAAGRALIQSGEGFVKPPKGVSADVIYRDNRPKAVWWPNPSVPLDRWTKAWDDYDRSRGARGLNTTLHGVRWDQIPARLRRQYMDAGGNPGQQWRDAVMADAIGRTIAPVYRRHPHIARMPASQQAALMSFYYNAGASPKGKETLEAAIKANDPKAIASALTLYVKSGGKVVPGLVKRRNAEAAAFGTDAARPTLGPRLRSQPLHVTVGKGDTLWKLWRTRLGAYGRDFDEFLAHVRRLNPGIDTDRLALGQRIRME